jgi:hypothetical protein
MSPLKSAVVRRLMTDSMLQISRFEPAKCISGEVQKRRRGIMAIATPSMACSASVMDGEHIRSRSMV